MFDFLHPLTFASESNKSTMEEFNEKQLWIMHHALEIFAAKGFEGTSVRDIAKAANVNVSMISYYFGSKEKLLEAIVKNHSIKTQHHLASIAFSANTSPFVKITRIVDHYINVFTSQSRFRNLLHTEIKAMDPTGPVFIMIRDMKKANKAFLAQTIREGQEKGVFRNDVDVSMLVYSIVGVLNYIVSNKPFICEDNGLDPDDDEAYREKIIDKMGQHIKDSILALITVVPHEK